MFGKLITKQLQPEEPWDGITGYCIADLYFGNRYRTHWPHPCNPESYGLRTNDDKGRMLYRTTWSLFYVGSLSVACVEIDRFADGRRVVCDTAEWNLPYERLVARRAHVPSTG